MKLSNRRSVNVREADPIDEILASEERAEEKMMREAMLTNYNAKLPAPLATSPMPQLSPGTPWYDKGTPEERDDALYELAQGAELDADMIASARLGSPAVRYEDIISDMLMRRPPVLRRR